MNNDDISNSQQINQKTSNILSEIDFSPNKFFKNKV